MDQYRYLNTARALLVVCLALHVAAMFPAYLQPGVSVVSTNEQMSEFICLEVGWAVAALLMLSRPLVAAATALGLGLGAVEIGFVVADMSTSFQQANGASPGHWLALAGLLAGFAGLLLAGSSLSLGRPRLTPANRSRVVVAAALATLAVVAYFPNWESGVLKEFSGNAFLQPPAVMAGAMTSAVLLAAVVILGSMWQPEGVGAWGIAGAATALASQLLSAYYLSKEDFSPTALVPGHRVALSAYWTADVVAVAGLLVLALWAISASTRPAPAPAEGDGAPGGAGARGESEQRRPEDGDEGSWPGHHNWPAHHDWPAGGL